MADKEIQNLPRATSVEDEDLFVLEQNGQAKSLEGGLFKGFAGETAEAYAIGERSGSPVGPDDPAYHNNAKWYSERSSESASQSNASAAAAAGRVTEASGYASQAQSRANEAAGYRDAAQSAATEAQSIVEGNVLCYDYDADVQYKMAFSVRGGFPIVTFTEA